MRDREEDALDAGALDEEVFQWISEEDEDALSLDAPKVGRPRINECWSRCISLTHDDLTAHHSYEIASDLKLDAALVQTLAEADAAKTLFWPKTYYAGLSGWDLDAHRLSIGQLQHYGALVTQMRQSFRDAAQHAAFDLQERDDLID